MSNGYAGSASHRENLSALVDGELTAATAVTAACAAWKDDAQMRAAWHGYQLIGDVLRSEDLASQPARDDAFMQALRERLAAEPVVLAPSANAQPMRSAHASSAGGPRRSWAMPAAVAAGFVMVAGALLVARAPAPVANPVLAGNTRPAALAATGPSTLVTVVSSPPGEPTTAPVVVFDPAIGHGNTFVTSNRILLRDPQLDRYLAAHQQLIGSRVLGVPSAGFGRTTSAEAPGR